eukprot:scaffold15513_cov30-Phaeocystis_antarctica.AAC.1
MRNLKFKILDASIAPEPINRKPCHTGLEPQTSRQGPRRHSATHTFDPRLGQAAAARSSRRRAAWPTRHSSWPPRA